MPGKKRAYTANERVVFTLPGFSRPELVPGAVDRNESEYAYRATKIFVGISVGMLMDAKIYIKYF
ncbi:MAG: hypothetical protein LBN33_04620 [Desulfovibrio sp.]|jgi:hypothetical protein|nr:hypothetical protein [Desulfovibrio sp.]